MVQNSNAHCHFQLWVTNAMHFVCLNYDKQFTLSVPIMGDNPKRKRRQMYVLPSLDV